MGSNKKVSKASSTRSIARGGGGSSAGELVCLAREG